MFPFAVGKRMGMKDKRLRSTETDRLLRDSVFVVGRRKAMQPLSRVVIDMIPGKALYIVETLGGTMSS